MSSTQKPRDGIRVSSAVIKRPLPEASWGRKQFIPFLAALWWFVMEGSQGRTQSRNLGGRN